MNSDMTPLDTAQVDVSLAAALQSAESGKLEAVELIAAADRLNTAGRTAEAIRLYQTWLEHTESPLKHLIQFNLATMLTQFNRLAEAEALYRAAIYNRPDFVQAWFNFGSVAERLGRKEHALMIWQSMLDRPLVGPDLNRDMYLLVLNGMGRLMEELRQFDAAEAKLLASLQVDPHQTRVIPHWVHLRQKQCRWPVFTEVPGLSTGEMLKWTSPLAMLSASADPGMQLATAMRFAYERIDMRVPSLAPATGYRHDRIRIGFLSADLSMHAVSQLTVELFELIDRQEFEVYAFCWSREDGTQFRSRVVNAFDHFVRIDSMDDAAAAKTVRSHEIDVVIDLHGLTSGARPNILAYRPAPVQVTYLGFAGTTGHPCIDYVIADRFLIPDAERPYYSEAPLYLDEVYQCSDRQRAVARLPTRAECGLPEDKFVFCSHNNNYKFNEEVFGCWMRILDQVPDSVLWLLEDNQWAQASLREHAQGQGIDASRLIFAPRAAPPEYLARFTVADLFLDTYPCNAGATANDVLWMGLPILTRAGRAFASRMAGSLLTSLGMPELITQEIGEYERQAVHLATHPEEFARLREKLADAKQTSPLFDMPRFARHFGDAIKTCVVRRP